MVYYRAISSAVERLPYKQDVPGSNPGSPIHYFLMPEIVNLSISQSAASELSRQASFGGSPGEMSIDLVEDKNCSERWMDIKLRPGTCNGSPISRTEGVTLYADVKNFNLLKDLKLDYYGDLSGGGFLI